MKWKHLTAAAAAASALGGTAQAALIDRGGGMIYDSTLNITWLQDWNYANTSGAPAFGLMDWDAANTWANNLVYGGFSDWRLPSVRDTGAPGCDYSNAGGTDCGFNVQTASGGTVFSEMAHLYYVTLGNKGYCTPGDAVCSTPQAGWGLANKGPFTNVVSGIYWTGTEYAAAAGEAWHFLADAGLQFHSGKSTGHFVVAVRPGDVAAVPEPHTLALMLLGLGGLAVAARRPR